MLYLLQEVRRESRQLANAALPPGNHFLRFTSAAWFNALGGLSKPRRNRGIRGRLCSLPHLQQLAISVELVLVVLVVQHEGVAGCFLSLEFDLEGVVVALLALSKIRLVCRNHQDGPDHSPPSPSTALLPPSNLRRILLAYAHCKTRNHPPVDTHNPATPTKHTQPTTHSPPSHSIGLQLKRPACIRHTRHTSRAPCSTPRVRSPGSRLF